MPSTPPVTRKPKERNRKGQGGRPPFVDLGRRLTVQVASEALGVSGVTVRNMVRRGVLRPIEGSVPMTFAREELMRVAALAGVELKTAPTQGDLAARAFRAFREGKAVRDVVIEQNITPDYAEQLLYRYATMGGDLVLPGEAVRRIRELGFFRNRPIDPRELPDILEGLLSYCEELDPDAREARAATAPPTGGRTS